METKKITFDGYTIKVIKDDLEIFLQEDDWEKEPKTVKIQVEGVTFWVTQGTKHKLLKAQV